MARKRWLASVMSLVMVLALVLTACSGKKDSGNSGGSNSGTNTSTNQGSTNTGSSEGGEVKDKVTFTMFVAAQGQKDIITNQTVIGKILEDETGVNWDIEYLVGDMQTKIGTMIISGDYPDVLVPDDGIEQVVEARGFIDLTPYLESDEYPNVKRVFEPYIDKMKWPDGKIYILPFSVVVNEYLPDPNIGQGAFWIQRRVLEWAGFPKIKTVDQYFQVIEDFIKAHPNEDLTGFLSLTDTSLFFTTTNVPNHLAGYPNDGEVMVDMNTHEAKIYAGTEYEYRWFKKLNELNAKDLFDKASFTDNYDQFLAKLTSHKVLGFFAYGWQFMDAEAALKEAALQDPSQDQYRYFPLPVVFDENIKDQYLDLPGFVQNRGWGITVKAKNPDRIMKFVDYVLQEDVQKLVKWGKEGETYLVDENGRMYRTQEMIDMMTEQFREEYGLTIFDWDWPHYGNESTFSDGNAVVPDRQPEVFQLALSEQDKKFLNAYGVQTYTELFTKPDDRPWFPAWGIPRDDERQLFETLKAQVQREWLPKLVFAKPEDYDKVWQDYLAELNKLDIKGYEQWYTEKIRELVANAK